MQQAKSGNGESYSEKQSGTKLPLKNKIKIKTKIIFRVKISVNLAIALTVI